MPKSAEAMIHAVFGKGYVNTVRGERLFECQKINPTTAYAIVQTKTPGKPWTVFLAVEKDGEIKGTKTPCGDMFEATAYVERLKGAKHASK